jgi:3-phenylpropionate/cinnamic acid dioxygenase small subunit
MGGTRMSWVEDRLEILDLLARYSHAVDDGAAEDYVGCFTDDGAFHGRVGMPDEIHVEGRAALLAFAESFVARRGLTQNRHIQTNTTVLEQTDTTARARTYLLVMQTRGVNPPEPGLTSVYEDQLAKTDKGWRIQLRRAIPDRKAALRNTARQA